MHLPTWISGSSTFAQATHFTLPLELEEGRRVRTWRRVLHISSIAVVAGAVWATLTPIRELALAPGTIIPLGDAKLVQHLEGGIVAEILAYSGSIVRAGDGIIRLSDGQISRETGQLQARVEALILQKQQLTALLASETLELRLSIGGASDVAAAQRAVHASRLLARNDESRMLETRIQQRRAEIAGLENEIAGFNRLVEVHAERTRMQEELLEKGLTSRREYLASKAAVEQARSQLMAGETRLATLREQLAEAESQLSNAEAEARRRWSEEMSKVEGELSEAREALGRLEERAERLIMRAPADGIVQFVTPKGSGEVVKPGDTVARIVPVDRPLVAEVEVRADDVGHVKAGNPAEVRVSTFDTSIYGKIPGRVSALSASSFQRQNGEYYFKATVALERQTVADGVVVSPGMVVAAEIVTGAKSFAQYLLKPVLKAFGPAFSEK
jgi:HlyD family secretion protein/adhesin transport system membrane fusion protein